MSSLGSLYTSLAGLYAFTNALDNLSGNVANINTPGYKGTDLLFRELLDGDGNSSGVAVFDSSLRFGDGDVSDTGNSTDLAINGNGFFILMDDNGEIYTRAGQFSFNEDGVLVDSVTGLEVAALDEDGNLVAVDIDDFSTSMPEATTEVLLKGNLNAGSAEEDTFPEDIFANPFEFEVFDSVGTRVKLRMVFTNEAPNEWSVSIMDENNNEVVNAFNIVFDEDTGEIIEGMEKFTFSFQPFKLLNEEDDFSIEPGDEVTVEDGDIRTASETNLVLEEGQFFISRDGSNLSFTSAGAFKFDEDGFLLDPDTEERVAAIDDNGKIVDFSIENLLHFPITATELVEFSGNLNSATDTGDTYPPEGADPITVSIIDSSGETQVLSVVYTREANNDWQVQILDEYGNVLGEGIIGFDDNGLPLHFSNELTIGYQPFSLLADEVIHEILETGDAVEVPDAGLTEADSINLSFDLDKLPESDEEGEDEGLTEDDGAFFVIKGDDGFEFVENGSFKFDDEGFLIDADSDKRIYGVDEQGQLNEINITDFLTTDSIPTTFIDFVGNLNPNAEQESTFPDESATEPFDFVVVDNDGNSHTFSIVLTRNDEGQNPLIDSTWVVQVLDENGNSIGHDRYLRFDDNGTLFLDSSIFNLSYSNYSAGNLTDFVERFNNGLQITVNNGNLDVTDTFNLAVDNSSILEDNPEEKLFLVVRDGFEIRYIEDGDFSFDSDGFLIETGTGMRVAALNNDGAFEDITVADLLESTATATSNVQVSGFLNADTEQGDIFPPENQQFLTNVEVINAEGDEFQLHVEFTKAENDNWKVQVKDQYGTLVGIEHTLVFPGNGVNPSSGATFNVNFQPYTPVALSSYSDLFIPGLIVNPDNGIFGSQDIITVATRDGASLVFRNNINEVEYKDTAQLIVNNEGLLQDVETGKILAAIDNTGKLDDFDLNDLLTNSGFTTTEVILTGNLDSLSAVGNTYPADPVNNPYTITVVDTQGNNHQLELLFTKQINNEWQVDIFDTAGNLISGGHRIAFNANGLPLHFYNSFTMDVDLFEPLSSTTADQVFVPDGAVAVSGGDPSVSSAMSLSIDDANAEGNASFILLDTDGYQFVDTVDAVFDSSGNLLDQISNLPIAAINNSGLYVQFDLSTAMTNPPRVTTAIDMSGTLDASTVLGISYPLDPVGSPLQVNVFDSLGNSHFVDLVFTRLAGDNWDLEVFDNTGASLSAGNTLNFNPDGSINAANNSLVFNFTPAGAASTNITLDLNDLVNEAASSSISFDSVNGRADGTEITDLVFDADGNLQIGYNNGAVVQNSRLAIVERFGNINEEILFSFGEADTNEGVTSITGASTLVVDTIDGGASQTVSSLYFDANGILQVEYITGATLSGQQIALVNELSFDTNINFSFKANGTNPGVVNQDDGVADIDVMNVDGVDTGVISELGFDEQGILQLIYSNGKTAIGQQLAFVNLSGFTVEDVAMNFRHDDGVIQADDDFGNRLHIDSTDGSVAGVLSQYEFDQNAYLHLQYDSGESYQLAKMAVVSTYEIEASEISFHFGDANTGDGITHIADEDTTITVDSVDGNVEIGIESFSFDEEGLLTLNYENGETKEGPQIAVAEKTGSGLEDVTLDLSGGEETDGITSVNGNSTLEVEDIDGRATGELVDIKFDTEGNIVATYSNGEEEEVRRLGIATFQNLHSLASVDGVTFKVNDLSGRTIGYASDDGFGEIAPGSLELSNVDLTAEFADIIVVQRGYQASSQALNVTNELIEELYRSVQGS